MVSKVRRPAPSPSRYTNRTRLLAAVLVFILLGSGIAVVLANVGNEPDAEEAFVPTDCPTADRSGAPVLDFDRPPPMCIGPSGDYTAVFDTTEGEVKVRLDPDRTPNTVNNFVVLANYGYYDDTLLFRLDPTIAIIQGGSPHTQDWSDPGPGYNIPDEGGLFLPLTNGSVRGPFTYRPASTVPGPSSSSPRVPRSQRLTRRAPTSSSARPTRRASASSKESWTFTGLTRAPRMAEALAGR